MPYCSWPLTLNIFSLSVCQAHAGNADMIQPGLIPLQPNLDFMDSFDPLQGQQLDTAEVQVAGSNRSD